MAKSQQRSNREAKKPKQDKAKPAPAPSPFSIQPPGKPTASSGKKK